MLCPNHRTKRYKVVSIIGATICVVSYVLILLRWRGPINVWESLYIFPASFGVGLLNSSQFVGVSTTVERPQLATTVSIFFLSQQMGMMIGASGSGALLQRTFRNSLVRSLGDRVDSVQVSIVSRSIIYAMEVPTFSSRRERRLLIGSVLPSRPSKEYSMTRNIRSVYRRPCKR